MGTEAGAIADLAGRCTLDALPPRSSDCACIRGLAGIFLPLSALTIWMWLQHHDCSPARQLRHYGIIDNGGDFNATGRTGIIHPCTLTPLLQSAYSTLLLNTPCSSYGGLAPLQMELEPQAFNRNPSIVEPPLGFWQSISASTKHKNYGRVGIGASKTFPAKNATPNSETELPVLPSGIALRHA